VEAFVLGTEVGQAVGKELQVARRHGRVALVSGDGRRTQQARMHHAHLVGLQHEAAARRRDDGVGAWGAQVLDGRAAALVHDAGRRLRVDVAADAFQRGRDLGGHRLLVGHRIRAFLDVRQVLVVGVAVGVRLRGFGMGCRYDQCAQCAQGAGGQDGRDVGQLHVVSGS
jgi:hypothetical protein